ncbi:hypothetical protein [Brevibacillus choshinensis]|uniref:hypothetical protein n=1 Tax=Brevibacillus choshinensis TaxID=54911 RepID=UPI002E219DFB|nr:hypothetical protein [Brevibacillus choshinensis]
MKAPGSEHNEVYFIRPTFRWTLILIPSWLVTASCSIYNYMLLTQSVNVIDNRLRALFVLLVSINGVLTYLLIGYLQVIRKIAAKNILLDLLRNCPDIVDQKFGRWSIQTEHPGIKQSEDIQLLKRLKHKDILEVLERYQTKLHEPFK